MRTEPRRTRPDGGPAKKSHEQSEVRGYGLLIILAAAVVVVFLGLAALAARTAMINGWL